MKVLYIAKGMRGSGGLECILLRKASSRCDDYHYLVRLIVETESLGERFYPHESGSAVAHITAYRRGLRRAVAQFQPDVVCICDDGLKALPVPLFLRRTRRSLLSECHAFLELTRSCWRKAVMRPLARLYDRLDLLTEGSVKEWLVLGLLVRNSWQLLEKSELARPAEAYFAPTRSARVLS